MSFNSQLARVAKNVLQLFYAITKVNWLEAIRLYDRHADVGILLSFLKGRFGIELVCWDLAYIAACISSNQKFFVTGSLSECAHKKIFWSPSKRLVGGSHLTYSARLVQFAQEAERRGNLLAPSSFEVSFLENKAYMHDYFKEHDIRTPTTSVYRDKEEIDYKELSFPLLVKGEHSTAGEAVIKINSREDLEVRIDSTQFRAKNNNIILQALLNIKKDLRVIYVGSEIVLHYWRINNSDTWRPTSTSFGSTVDFVTFPEQWRSFIQGAISKCGLRMGAFDIAWQNDDLSSEPYILEVSPRFSPNPSAPLSASRDYGQWKKKLWGTRTFYMLLTDQIFEIGAKYKQSVGW